MFLTLRQKNIKFVEEFFFVENLPKTSTDEALATSILRKKILYKVKAKFFNKFLLFLRPIRKNNNKKITHYGKSV